MEAVKDPDRVMEGRKGRLISQKAIDDDHIIRVIYEKVNNTIYIVTFYPARSERYESKI